MQLVKQIQDFTGPYFKDLYGEKAALKLKTEMGFIKQALEKKDSKGRPSPLLKCTPESIAVCIKTAANLDMSFDPSLQHLYMLPFGNQAQLDISAKGQIYFLAQANVIVRALVDTVHQNDTFRDNGLMEPPTHVRQSFKERGKLLTAYCYYELPNGKWHGRVLTQDEINLRHNLAKRKNRGELGFFYQNFAEKMLMKTAVREARYGLPYGKALAKMDEIDNQHFDVSKLDITDTRLSEIQEELGRYKVKTDLPALSKYFRSLQKWEQTHFKVVPLFKEARERIENTLEVPENA